MKVSSWDEARARMYEALPEVEGYGVAVRLWQRADSFAFAVSCNGTKRVIWVGPRGGVSTALRYTDWEWNELIAGMPS